MFETSLVAARPGLKSPWAYPLTAGLYLGTFLIAWAVSLLAVSPGPPPEGRGEIHFLNLTGPSTSSAEFRQAGGGGGGGGKKPDPQPKPPKSAELEQPTTVPDDSVSPEPASPDQDSGTVDDEVEGSEIGGLPVGPGFGFGEGSGTGTGSGSGFFGDGFLEGFAPQAQLPVEITSEMQRPVLMIRVEPEYPKLARTVRQQGLVVLKAVINENGDVENLRVIEGFPLLNDAAVAAVRQWKYTPARLDGRPIKVFFEVRVRFTLN